MKFFHKNSSTILVILLFVAVMVAYNYLWKPGQSDFSEEAAAVGTDLIELANTLQGVSLGTDLFAKPSYTSLEDFSAPLAPQPLGRENPFQ